MMKRTFAFAFLLVTQILGKNLIIDYPDFEDYTLPNGLRILAAEHHEQPAVFFKMLTEVSKRDVPIGKEGLDGITIELMFKGTTDHDADEISALIDGTGGSLSGSSGLEFTTFTGRFLVEDLEVGLNLLSEILRRPSFPKKEFRLLLKQWKEAIKTWYSDPPTVADAHAERLLMGDTPMGRMETQKSLRSISLDDIRSHYEKIRPDNSTLVIIGDFESERAKTLVEAALGPWQVSGSKASQPSFDYEPVDGLRFRFVENPELEQATIQIFQWGIRASSEHRYASRLANYIFGGGSFSSRLMDVIRAESGKTYGVRSWINRQRDYGTFGIRTSTRNPEVLNTYNLIINELTKIREEGVTEDELEKAKSYYSGADPLKIESPGTIASNVASALYYGFSIEDLETDLVRLNDVTLGEVNDAIGRYFDAENFVLVIVGKSEEIKEKIATIGPFDEAFYKDDVK